MRNFSKQKLPCPKRRRAVVSEREFTKQDFKLYLTVILIVLGIVSSVIIVTVVWNLLTVKRDSIIAFLDENGGVDDLIHNMTVNDYWNGTVVIGNREGRSMLYKVFVKAGNVSTVTSRSAPASINVYNVTVLEACLSHNQMTWIGIQCNLTKVQNDTKLIFELWSLNTVTQMFQYSGHWAHKWVNVTT